MTIIDPRGSRQHFPAFGLRAAGVGLIAAIVMVALMASESAGRSEARSSVTAVLPDPLAARLPAIAATAHRFSAVCGPDGMPSFGFVEFDRLPLQPVGPSIPQPTTMASCVLARQGSGFWALALTGD